MVLFMKFGIVDTTFSRVNMGQIALDEFKKFGILSVERKTVPGIKDLAVECKILLDSGCDIVMALGMVGGMPIDQQCAHEASLGIQNAKLMTNKHIIEVFVHENEAWSEIELLDIFDSRIRKHVQNTIDLIKNPLVLTTRAGFGIRQGKSDEGNLVSREKKFKIAIIRAMFNEEITSKMEETAIKMCTTLNLSYSLVRVPGVFDIPLPLKKSLLDKSISGAIVLGAVVKGDTSHDEVITKDCVSRVGSLIMEHKKPVTLGIIGHNVTWQGAADRQVSYAENAVVSLASLIETLSS